MSSCIKELLICFISDSFYFINLSGLHHLSVLFCSLFLFVFLFVFLCLSYFAHMDSLSLLVRYPICYCLSNKQRIKFFVLPFSLLLEKNEKLACIVFTDNQSPKFSFFNWPKLYLTSIIWVKFSQFLVKHILCSVCLSTHFSVFPCLPAFFSIYRCFMDSLSFLY